VNYFEVKHIEEYHVTTEKHTTLSGAFLLVSGHFMKTLAYNKQRVHFILATSVIMANMLILQE